MGAEATQFRHGRRLARVQPGRADPCFWFLQVMGLLGAIFGFIGLKQTKGGERGGRGLAIAGVIIGIVLVVSCVAFWIYFATNADCVRNGSSWECTTN